MPGMERHLFGLREEVLRTAIQCHLAHPAHRNELLGDQLGGVEEVELEGIRLLLLLDDLDAQLELGIVPHLDRFPKIAPVKVRVLPAQLL